MREKGQGLSIKALPGKASRKPVAERVRRCSLSPLDAHMAESFQLTLKEESSMPYAVVCRPFDPMRRVSEGMNLEECLVIFLLCAVFVDVGTVLARGEAVNIARPVFNFGGTLHLLFVGFSLRKFPRKEQLTHDDHDETNDNNTDDEGEREIENDFGSNAASRARIYKTDGDEIL